MRAALSILGLVVVLTIVLLMSKKQMQAVAPRPATGASSAAAGSGTAPDVLRQQVQGALKQAAQRASDAQP